MFKAQNNSNAIDCQLPFITKYLILQLHYCLEDLLDLQYLDIGGIFKVRGYSNLKKPRSDLPNLQ